MMTTVLRDSLGGNCCTAMVATISPSADQLPESIATCRFAQRVAQISNQVGCWLLIGSALVLPCGAFGARCCCTRLSDAHAVWEPQGYEPKVLGLGVHRSRQAVYWLLPPCCPVEH